MKDIDYVHDTVVEDDNEVGLPDLAVNLNRALTDTDEGDNRCPPALRPVKRERRGKLMVPERGKGKELSSIDDKFYIFVFKGKRSEDGKQVNDFQMIEVKKGASNNGFSEIILPNTFDGSKNKIVINKFNYHVTLLILVCGIVSIGVLGLNPNLFGYLLTAFGLGLRHGLDTDHIAVIDNNN